MIELLINKYEKNKIIKNSKISQIYQCYLKINYII